MPTTTSSDHRFGTDQVLLYDVAPWSQLGFGVPAFGDNVHTLNKVLWHLADVVSKAQLFIMTHIDAARIRPPSRNTIERLGKATNEVQRVLLGRQTPYAEARLEEGHGNPQPTPWLIRPVPYFVGPIVRNPWLREYNDLVMLTLTNIYQHTENDLALTLTNEAAGDIWSFFGRIQKLIGVELLGLDPAVVTAAGFKFETAHYDAYQPELLTMRMEAIESPADPRTRFTEDDLRPFVRGLPANTVVPNLARYPVDSIGDNFTGAQNNPLPADAAVAGHPNALDPVI